MRAARRTGEEELEDDRAGRRPDRLRRFLKGMKQLASAYARSVCVAGVQAAPYILARDTLVIDVLVRADTMDVLAEYSYTCQHDKPLSLSLAFFRFCPFSSRFLTLSLFPAYNLPSLFRSSFALVTSDRFHALPAFLAFLDYRRTPPRTYVLGGR